MTVALVATTFFCANHEISRRFLAAHGYIPNILSKSRLNRRLHRLPDTIWQALWQLLGEAAKAANQTGEYIIDSCPIPVCDNIRIKRCRLYRDEALQGKVASKRRFFYGRKGAQPGNLSR